MKGFVKYKKRGQEYSVKFSGTVAELLNLMKKHSKGKPVFIDRYSETTFTITDVETAVEEAG